MLGYLGIKPEQQVYTHCGGGIAASVPFFAAKFMLDYPKVKLYKESQLEWLRDDRGLMSQAIEQVYKSVAANIKAVAMTVGERRDISNGVAIKFYISTLHQMPNGKPIIVAGIHSYPFGKDYAVSFIMTAFSEATTGKEQETLIGVFNSFRLLGKRPAADESVKPAIPDGKKY